MEPQNLDHSNPAMMPTVTAVVAAILVLGTAAVYNFDRSFFNYALSVVTGRDMENEWKEAWGTVSLVEKGDFAKAAKEAQAVVVAGGVGANVAESALENGTFYTGTLENRLEAIRLTKESFFASAGDPLTQALKVNKLLSFIQIAWDPKVNEEVFKGEPFEKMWVPNDFSSSIRNLAEFSISLYPTHNAYFHTGVWYIDRIRNTYGMWNATKDEKKKYADELLNIIGIVDKIFAKNRDEMTGRAFAYMEHFHMLATKVYFYSVVARVYPEYLTQTKESFDALKKEYDVIRMKTGGYNAYAASRMPDSYFVYASTLNDVKGKSAYPEVAATIDELIQFVESDPKPHEGFYLAFLRIDRSGWTAAEKKAKLGPFLRLAKVHPPFKEFLMRNGWTFEQ